jgi:hypothetical protein
MNPFDLVAALRGEPVYHVQRNLFVENVTKVGNRVAFTIPDDGDTIYTCSVEGKRYDTEGTVLMMHTKTKPLFINLWNSPSNHYTQYDTLIAALVDKSGLADDSKSTRRHERLNKEPIEIMVEF